MAKKPTYAELEQRIKALEEEVIERKQAEEDLRKSEEALKSAQKIGNMGYWEIDLQSRKTVCSDQTFELFHRDPSQGSSEFMGDVAQYYPEDFKQLQEDVRRSIETGKSVKMDYQAKLPYGKSAYHCSTVHPIKDQTGRITKLRGALQDITERKQAEQAMKKSMKYFQLHSNLANTLIKIPSSELGKTIEYFLRRIVELFYVDRGAIMYWPEGAPQSREIYTWNRQGIKPYLPPAPTENYPYLAERLRDGKIFSFSNIDALPSEAQIEKDFFLNQGIKSAIRIPMIVEEGILGVLLLDSYGTEKTWSDDEVQQLRLFGQTFTYSLEKKHSEEALRESEDKLRAIFENVNDGIVYLDGQGSVIDINKRLEEIFGFKPEEVIGKHFFETEFCPPESKKKLAELYGRSTTGRLRNLREFVGLRKDGTEILIEASTRLIKKDGEINKILTVLRDITQRKKLEAKLQQTHKLEAIGTLAGGIAHDFNNILSAVIGFTEVAVYDVEKGTSAHNCLQEVLKAADRAKNLVQQILTFSRRSEKDSRPLQVKYIINEVLKLIRATLPATIEIRQDIRSNSLIEGDPTQIHQVLMNLCTNSAHALRNKGGVLDVNLVDVELVSESANTNSEMAPGIYTLLTVSDTGHGIEAEIIDRIFDPYFTTKKVGEGSGMGLAVVHGIVKDHGGHISVLSETDKGTTFHIFLPVIKGEVEPEIKYDEPLPKGNERILFVDDEEALVYTAKRTLERFGYEVVAEKNPAEAFDMFREQSDKFDLVITDMTMPQMTGDELAKAIIEIRPDIPVILCTGYSDRITEKIAKQMGVRAFVMKPMVVRELAKTIRRVLDKKVPS